MKVASRTNFQFVKIVLFKLKRLKVASRTFFCFSKIVLLDKTTKLKCRTNNCLGAYCSINSNNRSNLTIVRECSIEEKNESRQ